MENDWEEGRRAIDESALENFPWDGSKDKWFVHKDRPIEDRELFFGPLLGEETFVEFDDKANIFTILAKAGALPSASAARKNWKNISKKIEFDESETSVPNGFTMFVVGKKKFGVVILK